MASIYDSLPGPSGLVASKDADDSKRKRSKKRETLNTSDIREGHLKLSEMVDRAFQTLENAMVEADYATAIKAAQIILDRSGFGPKSTVDINATMTDLSGMSKDELADRASRIAKMLREKRGDDMTIDVSPIKTETVQ